MIVNIGIHKPNDIQVTSFVVADLPMRCRGFFHVAAQSFWPKKTIIEDELSDTWDNNVTKLLTKLGNSEAKQRFVCNAFFSLSDGI